MNVFKSLESSLDAQRASVTIAESAPVFEPGTKDEAFLLVHGWSASPESVRFLTKHLADAGFGVLVPVLPGHGTDAIDQVRFGPVDWFHATREALELLCEKYSRVHVLGVSMGGSLALQLAAMEPKRVASTITVNAPVAFDDPSFAETVLSGPADAPLPGWSAPMFVGDPVPEISYEDRTRKSAADLLSVCTLARELLPRIEAPLLVLQSTNDTIVNPKNANFIYANASSKRKEIGWLTHSFHCAQLDIDRSRIAELALEFASCCE